MSLRISLVICALHQSWHRTLFSSYLPPSQGGRYSGFGNQVESGPPRSSSVNDFYEGSVNGITNVSYIQL